MPTKEDRIRWLAEFSAARRRLRQVTGQSERYVIWFDTGKPRAVCLKKKPRPRPTHDETVVRLHEWAAFAPIFERVIIVQRDRCYLCVRRFGDGSARPSREHVVPRSKGGRNGRNILASCVVCNVAKGDRDPKPCEILFRDVVYDIIDASRPRSRGRKRKNPA